MRKSISLLFALILLLGLLSGCGKEEDPTEATAQPTATTAPVEEETEVPTEPEEEVEATEAPEETEVPEESSLNTVVLRSGDAELQAEYILLAVNPEGPFHSEDITLNEKGTEALVRWLLGDTSRQTLETYGTEEFGEPVFSVPEKPKGYLGWIPDADEETKTIRLTMVDTLEENGILEELLTEFEETYGYAVEVQSTSASGTLTMAKLGIFDLVLTEKSEATDAFITDGYARVLNGFEAEELPLCTLEYLLCGPKDDPAGVAEAENLADAFAAIAKTESRFLSRGDDSTSHKREVALWPANQAFGDWYLSVGTDMGPLLVMNEFECGYVLADKLTWLIFYRGNGII